MHQINLEELSPAEKKLLQAALNAGAKYLNKKGTRHVGASLLGENGKTYQGASIRRTNTSNSTCAERMALDKAVFEQCYDYKLLAIVGFCDDHSSKEVTPLCGPCRQIYSEAETYAQTRKPIPILLANDDFSKIIRTDSQELFPLAYEAKVYK